MGDGIMALFGASVAHEDHAVRACFTALRIQEVVKRHAGEATEKPVTRTRPASISSRPPPCCARWA